MDHEQRDYDFEVRFIDYQNDMESEGELMLLDLDNELPEELSKHRYDMLSAAEDITVRAKNDPEYTPTVEELELFVNAISINTAWGRSGDGDFIKKCMEERLLEKANVEESPIDEEIRYDHESCDDSNGHVLKYHFSKYVLDKLSQEQRNNLAVYMSQRLDASFKSNLHESTGNPYLSLLFYDLKPTGEALKTVCANVVNHVEMVVDDVRDNFPEYYGSYYYLKEFTLFHANKIIDGLLDHPHDKQFKIFMSQVMGERGLIKILNHLRKNMLSKDPELSSKSKDLLLYMMGDLKNKAEQSVPTADATVDEFYTSVFIEPGEYALNVGSKEQRVGMVKETLEKHGVAPGSRIAELACGTGWLSAGLREGGYSVSGYDKHADMVYIANNDYGNDHEILDWNNFEQIKQFVDRYCADKLDAIVINGRSVRHVENPISFFQDLSKTIKDGGILMWDTPDVEKEGSAQKDKLDAMREFLENFGFNKEWLKKYHWRMVGAPPGQNGEEHYIDSWTPSAQLAEWFCNSCGFELVETVREENYDGAGKSDNLYFVLRKVETGRIKEFREQANRRIYEYYDGQKSCKNDNLCEVYPLTSTHGGSAAF